MYDDILLATDGSDTASKAVMQGFEVAAKFDASVHILCVGAHADQANGKTSVTDAADFSRNNHPKCEKQRGAISMSMSGWPSGRAVLIERFLRMLTSRGSIYWCSERKDGLVSANSFSAALRRASFGKQRNLFSRRQQERHERSINVHEILIPTSGRPGTSAAVAHGIELCTAYSAQVHAVYVVDDTIDLGYRHISIQYENSGVTQRTKLQYRQHQLVSERRDRSFEEIQRPKFRSTSDLTVWISS